MKRFNRGIAMAAFFGAASCTQVSAKQDESASSFELSGDVMLDYSLFDSNFLEDSDTSADAFDLRRFKLSAKGQFQQDWQAKFQLGYADDELDIKDAYIQYSGWKWVDITVGQQKEAFGLERLMSMRNLFMTERSLSTKALAPGRSLGVNVSGEWSDVNWQLGYFTPQQSDTESALTGRVSWQAWKQKNNLLHLGLAFSERDMAGKEFRINQPMEVYFSDSVVEGSKLLADTQSLKGLELLWIQNSFSVMAEWQTAEVTDSDAEIYDYQGGYVQMAYQFNNGHRKYKNGELGASTGEGWELTSRYSHFELLNENKQFDIYSIGVNYAATKNLTFKADLLHSEQYESGAQIDSGLALTLRTQYKF